MSERAVNTPKLHSALVLIGITLFAFVVPVLEINDTHVFNPEWPAHARLHDVWQLLTNSGLGLFAIWLIWARGNVRLAGIITLFVTGGFLVAYLIRASYGGSMVLSDGSEKLVLGVNLGLAAFGLAFVLSAIAVVMDKRALPFPGGRKTDPH